MQVVPRLTIERMRHDGRVEVPLDEKSLDAAIAALRAADVEAVAVCFLHAWRDPRHEQIAAHIADGYARAKRTTAVVLSHLGPGLTNASTGVANAALDSIPMVVIAGDISISLGNVQLLTIRIRLLICSIDKAERLGIDWWKFDPHLTMGARTAPVALPASRRVRRTRVVRPLRSNR